MNGLSTREQQLFDLLAPFGNANFSSTAALKSIAEACFTKAPDIAEAQQILGDFRSDTNLGSDAAKIMVAKAFALIGIAASA